MKLLQKIDPIFSLKKGDLVDVVCLASAASFAEFREVKKLLNKNGLEARFCNAEEILVTKKPLNLLPHASAKIRFEQLRFALENKESKAVWCIRGGYGSAEIIPLLEKSAKIAQSKAFIGFSDITSLAIFLNQKWNWQIIYGPMLVQLAFNKVADKSKKTIFDLVFGKKNSLEYKIKNLSEKKSEPLNLSGELVGGCLSLIATHFATANEIEWKNKILFLEDIDETAEKIDRYFWQLIQIMLNKKSFPKAILLGNYSQGVTKNYQKEIIQITLENFAKKLQEIRLKIPVLLETSGCLGHSQNIMPLIIGAKISIINK